MTVIGAPSEWVDLIDSMIPEVLQLIIATWQQLPPPAGNAGEDEITYALCKALRANRTARELMFQIDTQQVELEPQPGQDLGRLDIAFRPLVPREDIYFCLECKRLNVLNNGKVRTYTAEYVTCGMIRFVTGQYARDVRHGGMLGYVLDGKVMAAITNIEANVKTHHLALCMTPPGAFQASSILVSDPQAKETHHQRAHEVVLFNIHHLFVSGAIPISVTAPVANTPAAPQDADHAPINKPQQV